VVLWDVADIVSYMNSSRFDPRAEVVLEEELPASVDAAPAAASSAEIKRYVFDQVEIAAEMSASGWVVLSDAFFPGWEATVDGVTTKILRADCALRAVAVPQGSHRVVFRYRPRSVVYGRITCAIGLLAVAAGLVSLRIRRGRSKTRPTGGKPDHTPPSTGV
jgi:hypothetical protein